MHFSMTRLDKHFNNHYHLFSYSLPSLRELNVTAMEDRSVSTNKETASNPQHANNFPQTTQDSSSSEGQEIEKACLAVL